MLFKRNTTKLNDLIASESWLAAAAHCRTNPKQAKKWSSHPGFFDGRHKSRLLPIHLAAALAPPIEVVDALVTVYPKGTMAPESHFGRVAAHIACMKHASADVVRTLLLCYPRAARVQDYLGRLPLHYACSNGASLEVVEVLLKTCKEAAKCRDVDGWLPVQIACTMGASWDVLQALLKANPKALDARLKEHVVARAEAERLQLNEQSARPLAAKSARTLEHKRLDTEPSRSKSLPATFAVMV